METLCILNSMETLCILNSKEYCSFRDSYQRTCNIVDKCKWATCPFQFAAKELVENVEGKFNVHIITGPNGMCMCGTAGKTCAEILQEKTESKIAPDKKEEITPAVAGQSSPQA